MYRLQFILLILTSWLLLAGCSKTTPKEQQSKIQDQVNTANSYVNQNNPAKAISLLENLSKTHPNHPDILEALAFSYAKLPNPKLAAFYFKQVLQIDPRRTELLPCTAQTYVSIGDWNAAEETYLACIEASPKNAHIWKALYEVHIKLNKPVEAINDFDRITELSNFTPKGPEIIQIGNLYRQASKPLKAIEFFELALKDSSSEAQHDALMALFELAVEGNNLSRAQECIKTLSKDFPAAEFKKDFVAKYNKVLEDYQVSLNIKRKEEERLVKERQRIEAEKKEKERLEKERIAKEELSQKPKDIKTVKLKQTTTETKTVEKIKKVPPPPTVNELLNIASKLRDEGKATDAIKQNWKAVNLEPHRGDVWHQLAKSYFINEENTQAETSVLESIRIEPKNVIFRLTYLKIIQKKYPPTRLINELEKAHYELPESPDIMLALARGYDKILSNTRDAHFLYTKFLERAPNHPARDTVEKAIRDLYIHKK